MLAGMSGALLPFELTQLQAQPAATYHITSGQTQQGAQLLLGLQHELGNQEKAWWPSLQAQSLVPT